MRKATSYKALLTFTAMLLMLVATEADGAPSKLPGKKFVHKSIVKPAIAKCPKTFQGIKENRLAVWKHQGYLGQDRHTTSVTQFKTIKSCAYASWINRLWINRLKKVQSEWNSLSDPARAICHIFGNYCSQALTVARCESGLSIYATNGQYLGLFQMGDYARSRYGHSYTALGQARSAYAYFSESGYNWSPWSCKPW